MPSLKTKCSTCFREFPTQRSLKKHCERKGHNFQERDIEFFNHGETEPVCLPLPRKVPASDEAAYKQFLNGVVELINSFLKPDVKSKWIKIDLIMVPIAHFENLLFDLGLSKPFSVREARHPPPLKQDSSTSFWYNVFDASSLNNIFATTSVPLKWKAYFRNNEEVRAPLTAVELSAKDKVALARQRAGTRWGAAKATSEKPTARRSLKCEGGEWPRTREFQLQWWPKVYAHANCGHVRLRFFVEHVSLAN